MSPCCSSFDSGRVRANSAAPSSWASACWKFSKRCRQRTSGFWAIFQSLAGKGSARSEILGRGSVTPEPTPQQFLYLLWMTQGRGKRGWRIENRGWRVGREAEDQGLIAKFRAKHGAGRVKDGAAEVFDGI